ncbi:MAG: hypothetical protein A2655_02435 [Candidatus Yanofskybacteria bacterium RIFCSPHIGHO2_01_FULL_43_42]|uniref:Uncharacterized protein n=1 Tax=Candidatus Yanofskybacteria bacterium RIFCSPLOWO2_01_FULL_43_22 TaxID=1802695 RepID=A0A1F8GI65_9BACT|nr:MAG: hypothetical protein A2655_02435 [Candidatus Yanofskybacteria bacterium RIFCSPHIGHO2_01_FULL_43_42]OGN13340.1 MAG: hypothetical protein A3D48_00615 [Candidatus Yanofskybacteria bacterium RIFCSPHIGHO2_02_FULL_43_17]OGN24386.1 MAG: hypothetical protein A3A13_01570 [Candidatus Yanofskybacteria bacterium RIFCSPLOWO2_01_FULL_43_22]
MTPTSDNKRSETISFLKSLKAGSVISVMVSGYKPKGEIYRALFFVDSHPLGATRSGIYGWFENELKMAPSRFVRYEDFIVADFVAEGFSRSAEYIKSLVLERNGLLYKIKNHNNFVREKLMIAV